MKKSIKDSSGRLNVCICPFLSRAAIVAILGAMVLYTIPSAPEALAKEDRAPQKPSTLVLVRDGKAAASIFLGKSPSRAAEFAAQELQEHINKITGAKLPICTETNNLKGVRILIGDSELTRGLGLKKDDFKPQEYLVRFLPDTLVLMGKDAGDHDPNGTRPQRVPGKFGQALCFDGINDFLYVPRNGFSDEAGTMEAWIQIPDGPVISGMIFCLETAHGYSSHKVSIDKNRVIYQVLNYKQVDPLRNSLGYESVPPEKILSGELKLGWHHISCTHSRAENKIELFVDGVSQGTAQCLPTVCRNHGLSIGVYSSSMPSQTFRGVIDEVRISDCVRKPVPSENPYEADKHTTLLIHFDEQNGIFDDRLCTFPDAFEEKGSLSATYYFLERYCGVRWYLPGEIGAVYPTVKTLKVNGVETRRAPLMKYRWMVPCLLRAPTKQDLTPAHDQKLWDLRIGVGGEPFENNHSLYGYYDRFLNAHPDWFAQGHPPDKKPPQLCYTNTEVIQQVVQDARDFFDGKGLHPRAVGAGNFFSACYMDNWDWCKCSRCQTELEPSEASPQDFFLSGRASNYYWGFVNRVAKEVKKTHPDKYISCFAYGENGYYPKKVTLESNIAVQMCLEPRNWWTPSVRKNNLRVLDEWTKKEKGRPLYLWLYYESSQANAGVSGEIGGFPAFTAHTVVEQMKIYHEGGIRGVFMEHTSEFDESFLNDQLECYLTLKLADDPTMDGNAMIDEFFARYYGAAAKPMKELYEGIERVWSDPASYPEEVRTSPGRFEPCQKFNWGSLGTAERMEAYGKLMAEAQRMAQTDIEKKRVDYFKRGIWDVMVAGKKKYEENHPLPPK